MTSAMASETHHLLSYEDSISEDSRVSVYTNHMTSSTEVDLDMNGALKVIREQAEMVAELRCQLVTERDNNTSLMTKMDFLFDEFEKLKNTYRHEISDRNIEIENLKMTLEAHNESQAAVTDELRFQMQSLRSKVEGGGSKSSGGGSKSHAVENGDPLLLRKSGKSKAKNSTPLHKAESPHTKRNSVDSSCSTNSNPYLLSQPMIVHRGEITWRINAFAKKLKRIVSGSYDDPTRSEPFTTGPCGYRLTAWAYLNGRGKGQNHCLSVYIRVMAGEYDPVLAWPIKPCYTFYLLSQDEDHNKRFDLVRVRDLSIKHSGIYRPFKDDKTIIVGFDDFILHEDIEKKNYMLNDSLFLKCVVEIPPP